MKKITKLIFIFLMAATFQSCKKSADKEECLKNVQAVFPNSVIYKSPELSFTFYVVDSTGIKEVTTNNISNTQINGITSFYKVN